MLSLDPAATRCGGEGIQRGYKPLEGVKDTCKQIVVLPAVLAVSVMAGGD